MTLYLATINTPGYMPMDDDPPTFETPREAWEYLREERERGLEHIEGDEGDDDAALATLDSLAKGYTKDSEQPGTVWGSTPGGAIHDLGLHYTVTALECECAYEPGDSGHELHCPLHAHVGIA